MDQTQDKIIGTDTLIPLSFVVSFVISLIGCVYFLSIVSAKTNQNEQDIRYIREKLDYTDQKIIKDITELKASSAATQAKLDILIDLNSRQAKR